MFGIDGVELVLILVLAALLLGPEKLPEYSRKVARIFVYLRDVANNTQQSLREQLGEGYEDLELRDLNPKTFVKKHLSQEIAALEEAKRDIAKMKTELEAATGQVSEEVAEARKAAKQTGEKPQLVEVATAPFDPEAT